MKFYGRTKEIDILRKIRKNSNKSAQFTVVTGRRRIGKTELIREAFGDSPYLYFFVARRTEKELCESFRSEIEAKLGEFLPGEQVKFRDIFKWVFDRLMSSGIVYGKSIRDEFKTTHSSLVVALFAYIPYFEIIDGPYIKIKAANSHHSSTRNRHR